MCMQLFSKEILHKRRQEILGFSSECKCDSYSAMDNNCDSGNNAVYSEVGAADVMKGFTISDNSSYIQPIKSAQSASNKKHACSKIALVILYIIVIALLLALVGAFIAFTMEISSIKSETGSFQTTSSLQVAHSQQLNS